MPNSRTIDAYGLFTTTTEEPRALRNDKRRQFREKTQKANFTDARALTLALRLSNFTESEIIGALIKSPFCQEDARPYVNNDAQLCFHVDFTDPGQPTCTVPCLIDFRRIYRSETGSWTEEKPERALSMNVRRPPSTGPEDANTLDGAGWPHPRRHRRNGHHFRLYCSQPNHRTTYCEYNGFGLYNPPCYILSPPNTSHIQ